MEHFIFINILPKRKIRHRLISGLFLELREINGALEQPRWRTGLEATELQAHFLQRSRQPRFRRFARAATSLLRIAHVHQPTQKCARGDDGRLAKILHAHHRFHAKHFPVFMDQLGNLPLLNGEIRLALANPFHPKLIGFFVALRTWRPYSGAFFEVQHSKLQPRHICALTHFPTKRVNFPRQMAFCQAAYRRIAAHLSDCIHISGQHQHLAANPRSRQRGLNPRVAGANDDDVKIFRISEAHVHQVEANNKARQTALPRQFYPSDHSRPNARKFCK